MMIPLFTGDRLAGEDFQWRFGDWDILCDSELSAITSAPCIFGPLTFLPCVIPLPPRPPRCDPPMIHPPDPGPMHQYPVSHRSYAMAPSAIFTAPACRGQVVRSPRSRSVCPRSDTSSVCQRITSRCEMRSGPPWTSGGSMDGIR
jgi:hypothetical protein